MRKKKRLRIKKNTKFGKFLKELRLSKGWNLRQLDRAADISQAYLHEMEAGIRPIPTLKILYRLAKGFEIPFNEFLVRVAECEEYEEPSNENEKV